MVHSDSPVQRWFYRFHQFETKLFGDYNSERDMGMQNCSGYNSERGMKMRNFYVDEDDQQDFDEDDVQDQDSEYKEGNNMKHIIATRCQKKMNIL